MCTACKFTMGIFDEKWQFSLSRNVLRSHLYWHRHHTTWIGHISRRIAVTDPKPHNGRQAATLDFSLRFPIFSCKFYDVSIKCSFHDLAVMIAFVLFCFLNLVRVFEWVAVGAGAR